VVDVCESVAELTITKRKPAEIGTHRFFMAALLWLPTQSYARKAAGQCPPWVKSRHVQRNSVCPLCANSGHWRNIF
ncbi:MAG: hypothetical protein WBW99_06155, partial [Pseudolabrys sp.]